jgi:hypothetical protein
MVKLIEEGEYIMMMMGEGVVEGNESADYFDVGS